jgi:AraC-like DNA-binding protein
MSDSVAIIERLHATGHVLSTSIGFSCSIVGPEREITLEMPPNHVGACYCKRLEALTGEERNIDHLFSHRDQVSKNAGNKAYSVYHCPYGLANIIVPAFDGNTFVAALQIGPIRTSPSDELLLNQHLLEKGVSGEKLDSIKQFLEQLPYGSISYVMDIAKLASTLITDDDLDFRSKSLDSDIDRSEVTFDIDDDLVCSIQQYIVENFTDNDMSLDLVAKHVYVHPSYISRIFSQQFNTPFRTYINGLRVNLASELLDTTDKSIGDICHDVGFSDHSYFNRVFKSIRGLTPSEYRNRARDGKRKSS